MNIDPDLERYQKAMVKLRARHRERDQKTLEELIEEGFSQEQAREAVQAIHYGGDCIDLDDPRWYEAEND